MNTRNTRSLSSYIKKHGEKEGKLLYEKAIADIPRYTTLAGLIEEHGQEQGTKKYNELVYKKGFYSTLDGYIHKYGKRGQELYIESCHKKGFNATLDGHIKKYGTEKGTFLYTENCIKRSSIYQELKKIYGEEIAMQKYKQHTKKELIEEIGYIPKTPPFYKSKKGNVSSVANLFFSRLEKELNIKLQYGTKREEKSLVDINTGKKYYYDCYDEQSNTLIEIHGEAFHPKLGDIEWNNPFGETYDKILTRDKTKESVARKNGFNYIVIWDMEVNTKTKSTKKIKQIKEQIHENKQNTKQHK